VKKGEEMITCVVKEKEEAKEEYKEAVELGKLIYFKPILLRFILIT